MRGQPCWFEGSKFAGGLALCVELPFPLKEGDTSIPEKLSRNAGDLGIPADMCKLVAYTDGGAAFRPCEGAVVMLMCGNEAVRVIGRASERVELQAMRSGWLNSLSLMTR